MSNMNENSNFSLVPKPPSGIKKVELGAKRILSGMVADTLALAKEARSFRIVHVDDENYILEMFGLAIREEFKDVVIDAFQNGDKAWEELQRADPDLLITDMNHVGMSGWEMLPLLANRKAKYPILVVSGWFLKNGEENIARQCAGPDLKVTFWTKSKFGMEQLTAYLRTQLDPNSTEAHER